MKRVGILTAGGDTPALNATLHGAVVRANQRRVEVFGFVKGFASLLSPEVPHLSLNPLYSEIPELDPTRGGTVLGASRAYVDSSEPGLLDQIEERVRRLGIDGLICIGGDGTLNGLQPLAERFPCVLAPKTIDNDLGLNYLNEPDEWVLDGGPAQPLAYKRIKTRAQFDLEQMVNYVTPGYATSVFVSTEGVQRLRTTAESHRRIAIVEVMGRHSGYIALGTAYGQPDIILVPEQPIDLARLLERVRELYDLQKNVVIVCGEGVVGPDGQVLGARKASHDPSGNVVLSGASEALREMLVEALGDGYFRATRRAESAAAAIFTRKVGHTQRGGRPIQFDRVHAKQLGAKALDMLLEGQSNALAILQWRRDTGFTVDGIPGNALRDRWGKIHARQMHPALYDPELMMPSRLGVEYLLPIFTRAVGHDDLEYQRHASFDSGNLFRPYHSVNTDIDKRIRYLGGLP